MTTDTNNVQLLLPTGDAETDALTLPQFAPAFEQAALAFPEVISMALARAGTSGKAILDLRRQTDAALTYAKTIQGELRDATAVINALVYGKLLLVARLGAMLPGPRPGPGPGRKTGGGVPTGFLRLEKHSASNYRKVAEHQRKLAEYRRAVAGYNDGAEYPAMMSVGHFLAFADTGHVLATAWSGKAEWYTPKDYVERVREVLGGIDLDPATCQTAQRVVRASQYYTRDDDGLAQQWRGKVFLNPPFRMPLISQFVNRLIDGVGSGDVTAAVLLTNNNTDTDWWQRAAKAAAAICFTDGRISFYDEGGEASSPTNGQTFCYYGTDLRRFAQVFAAVGFLSFRVTVHDDD